MRMRTRKLLGTIALLVLVVVWALLAMAFAQILLNSTSGLLAAVYYVVAGFGWVVLAIPLITWMARPDARRDSASKS
jgi:hypothetical protein